MVCMNGCEQQRQHICMHGHTATGTDTANECLLLFPLNRSLSLSFTLLLYRSAGIKARRYVERGKNKVAVIVSASAKRCATLGRNSEPTENIVYIVLSCMQ